MILIYADNVGVEFKGVDNGGFINSIVEGFVYPINIVGSGNIIGKYYYSSDH